jgi:23S rRNA pseudouridine955/2504/2580 synthase
LPHPAGGLLVIEAPLSPAMKAGFQRFGFEESEADPEPFRNLRRRR